MQAFLPHSSRSAILASCSEVANICDSLGVTRCGAAKWVNYIKKTPHHALVLITLFLKFCDIYYIKKHSPRILQLQNTMADSTYVYDGEEFPIPDAPLFTRPEPDMIFGDDICIHLNTAMKDAMRAAWNGWEAAVLCKSQELEDYYMRLINLIGASNAKLAKIAKSK